MTAVATLQALRAKELDVSPLQDSVGRDMDRSADLTTNPIPRALSPIHTDAPDSKQSTRHILSNTSPPAKSRPRSQSQLSVPLSASSPVKQPIIWIDGETGMAEDHVSTQNDSYTRAAEFNPSHTMTVAHTRRNANGTIGSVYSGNKIRHLKKEDGIPLWRKDIQLNFLECVFEDKTPAFTKASDATQGHTFADIYVDAMARSSKTSKILREKLLADRDGALSMAMICLLVNVGRMNTTLNFFPEMRAQLRTYHAIPSLQANQDPNAYKQLQDAPRLKSILKGASEDSNQPNTMDKIKAASIPRTNPVNLIFVLSQYAPKISEIHFHPPRDFFDLVMRGTLSSKSRANAFLWLIWWYLESDFTADSALNNPFGPGQPGEATGGLPLKVPAFEHLTEEQANMENVDTQPEIDYGEMKRIERRRILEEDETVGPPLKKSKKNPTSEDYGVIAISDTDPTRSPSPTLALQRTRSIDYSNHIMSVNGHGEEDGLPMMHFQTVTSKPDATHSQRLVLKTRLDDMPESSSPAPPGSGHPVINSAISNGHRRPRPETSHQKAVNVNRKMRIEHILHRKIVKDQTEARKHKLKANSSFGMMVMNRVRDLPEMYDTDDDKSWGPGGLLPNQQETEDFGEEAIRHKKVIDRAVRRLFREENGGPLGDMVRGYKRKRRSRGYADDEDERGGRSRKRRKDRNARGRDDGHENPGYDGGNQEELDDLDRDLLGEGRDEDDDSGTDDSEGNDGDATEEDMY